MDSLVICLHDTVIVPSKSVVGVITTPPVVNAIVPPAADVVYDCVVKPPKVRVTPPAFLPVIVNVN